MNCNSSRPDCQVFSSTNICPAINKDNNYVFKNLIGAKNSKFKKRGGKTKKAKELTSDQTPTKPTQAKFEPYKGKYRRPGTGSVHKVSKNVWEGRYSPKVNGKRIARNVYATSIEECEIKLAKLIEEMKSEIAEIKNSTMQPTIA